MAKPLARVCWIAVAFVTLFAGALRADSDSIVAVSSRVAKGYVRVRLPNGTFQPETYVFGEGGIWRGAERDPDADKMTFLEVAHTIATPLAGQKYYPGKDPKLTRLLIMVYWGTTNVPTPANQSGAYTQLANANAELNMTIQEAGPDLKNMKESSEEGTQHANAANPFVVAALAEADAAFGMVAAENHIRDERNAQNARLLGYDSWWNSTSDDPALGPALRAQHQIMIDELEDERYFVVLLAYDWQALCHTKQHRILWETRFSIRSHGHDFSKELAAMAKNAASYFGQSSDGLVHKMPQGHVWFGELKSLPDAGSDK